jgi:hypothetical protein
MIHHPQTCPIIDSLFEALPMLLRESSAESSVALTYAATYQRFVDDECMVDCLKIHRGREYPSWSFFAWKFDYALS